MRRREEGSARRTVKSPRSAVRGTTTRSIASQEGASPSLGSSAGKKLMARSTFIPSCPHLLRASTPYFSEKKNVDGRDKPGHDVELLPVERLGARGLAFGVAGDFFDTRLGFGEKRIATLLQRLAALVNLDGFLEGNVAFFKALHDLLELGKRLLEGERGHVGKIFFFFRHHLIRYPAFINSFTCAATESASPCRSYPPSTTNTPRLFACLWGMPMTFCVTQAKPNST